MPWFYYALLPVFFVGFLLVPGSVGAIACFLIVNITPQRRKQALAAVLAVLVVGGGVWVYQTLDEMRRPRSNRDALQWLDARFAFSRAPLMPSHWMTRGLQAAARGDPASAAYPLALLWANGLMLYVAAAATAGRLYRRGYSRLATGGSIRKRYGAAWLDRAGRTADKDGRHAWASVRSFLDDLAVLSEMFDLVVAGRHHQRGEWKSLEEHEQGFRNGPGFQEFFAAVRPFFYEIDEMKHYGRTAVASA